MILHWFAEKLEWVEEKTKPLFVAVALILYVISLIQLFLEINITTDFDKFLVKALSNLSIPFGVILLQELLELVSSISHSTLKSGYRQFQIVILVIVRSFFKNFSYVNDKVSSGTFGEPVQQAIVKVFAIIIMTGLIIYFKQLTKSPFVKDYISQARTFNLYKQVVVVVLVIYSLVDLIVITSSYENIKFISFIFTGLIVIEAIFLILSILRDHEFDTLAFESSLVISLIFARFPLFTSNILAYSLAILGVIFATASLYLFNRSRQQAALDPAMESSH